MIVFFFFELLLAPSVVDAPITDLPEDRLKAIPLASPSRGAKNFSFLFLKANHDGISVNRALRIEVLTEYWFFLKKKIFKTMCVFSSQSVKTKGTLCRPFTQYPHRLIVWTVTSYHFTEGVNYVANCAVVS